MDGLFDVLVVIAHPDDEVFVSGTICLCAERGFRIGLVAVTSGEGGSRKLLRASDGVERLADIRRQELRFSAQVLGIAEVTFLEQADVAFPDRRGKGAWDLDKVINALGGIIRAAAPGLILTHGPRGGYGNVSHMLVYHCVTAAAKSAAVKASIFSFCGRTPGAFFSWHFDDESAVLIDARPFHAQQVASLECHRSQIDFFTQPQFPNTFRKYLSAMFSYAFRWTEAGKKRVPIGTAARFFAKFPTEGLCLRGNPQGRAHFFAEQFEDDARIRIVD